MCQHVVLWRRGKRLPSIFDLNNSLTLQPACAFTQKVGQVLQIIAGSDAEASNQVPCCSLQVAITVLRWKVILGPAEVGVAGDGGRTFELLQTSLGLFLGCWVELISSEEFVGRDTLLVTESGFSSFQLLL